MRLYAIGDIHGQMDELRRVHAWIAADRARSGWTDAPVIHLGDLVDRGPDSAGVIAYLLAGPAPGKRRSTQAAVRAESSRSGTPGSSGSVGRPD